MPHILLRLSFVLSIAAAATAQQVIATVYGTIGNGQLGTVVRAVGDIDGDGVGDFVASAPNATPGRALLISGATRATLATFISSVGNGFGDRDVNPIGDVNGDGTVDFAIGYSNRGPLEVYSGASGARLYTLGAPFEYFGFACSVGDYDGDGRDDFAAMLYVNSTPQIWVLRGLTGTQLGIVTTSSQSDGYLRNLGDLNGDGFSEIAACGRVTAIYDLHPIHLLRSINLNGISNGPFRSVDVADMDGDGRKDLIYGFNAGQHLPFLYIISATTGATLRSFALPPGDGGQPPGEVAVLPDLDGDGVPDLVANGNFDPLNSILGYGQLVLMSGSDGHRIGVWSGSPQFSGGGPVAGVGDVDGDGFGDFVIGGAGEAQGRGGWQLISGRVLANRIDKPVNCYSGPFPPQLGITRPVLGQGMTVVGRDAPVGALGIAVMSFLPPDRTNLGVVGCDAWFDPANWFLLGLPATAPSWQFSLPIPSRRGLGGFEVAVQALYLGTATPVGLDLSNGVWARLGY